MKGAFAIMGLLEQIIIEFPVVVTISQPYIHLMVWWFLIFVIALFFKISKKMPNTKEGIIAALSILVFCVAYALIHIFKPLGLDDYLVLPLPFLDFQEGNMILMAYEVNEKGWVVIPKLCSNITSMLLLAFLVNQIYAFKPGNLKTPGWLVFRFFSTLIAIGVYYGVHLVLRKFLGRIPDGSELQHFMRFVPILLLGALISLFLVAWCKKHMGIFQKVINPAFEGMYGFFFTNRFGVQLTRAMATTLILTLFAVSLQKVFINHGLALTIPLRPVSGEAMFALAGLFILWIIVGFLM